MGSAKRVRIEKEDRISELPSNVLDCNFDGMPIRDAARTSILSRKWRYIWASYPKLVFDINFYNELFIKHKHSVIFEFPKAINKTLFGHCGPILDFFLYIPKLPNDITMEIDQWMLFLSKNGIKELELKNLNVIPYTLPSCILTCRSLIALKLTKCVWKPLHAFGSFRSLVKLKLYKVSFSSGISATLLINAQVLEKLTIMNCTGIDHKLIYVPMITSFAVLKSGKVDWRRFKSYKQLTALQVSLGMEVKKNTEESINMMMFIKYVPKVRKLWLDGFSLKHLAAGTPSQSLEPTTAQFLTRVRLRHIRVDDLDQLSSALFLLKICPILKVLELDLATSTDNITEPVKGYLESSNCMTLSLDNLHTVEIRCVKGLEAELLFIKFLLSRLTHLKKMLIEQSTEVDASDGFKISRDLLRFSRASSSAEVIHVVPNGS